MPVSLLPPFHETQPERDLHVPLHWFLLFLDIGFTGGFRGCLEGLPQLSEVTIVVQDEAFFKLRGRDSEDEFVEWAVGKSMDDRFKVNLEVTEAI